MSKMTPNQFASAAIRATCPNCGRFLGRIAGAAEFPPCHNCGWQTTLAPPRR